MDVIVVEVRGGTQLANPQVAAFDVEKDSIGHLRMTFLIREIHVEVSTLRPDSREPLPPGIYFT